MTKTRRQAKRTPVPSDRWTTRRSLLGVLLVLACGASVTVWSQPPGAQPGSAAPLSTPTQPEKSPILFAHNDASDTKPIHIAADEVASWKTDKRHVLRFRGHVLIRFGAVQAICERCAVWVDLARFRKDQVWQVRIYGESSCSLEAGELSSRGDRMLLDFSTRGKLQVHSSKETIQRTNLARDPLVLRGEDFTRQATPQSNEQSTIRRTSGQPGYPPLPTIPTSIGEVSPLPSVDPVPGAGSTRSTGVPIEPLPTVPGTSTSHQPRLPTPSREPLPQPDPNKLPPLPPGSPPPLPPPSQPSRPRPPRPALGVAPQRQYSVAPRSEGGFDIKMEPLGENEQAVIVTGGVILEVRNAPNIGLLDIEADQLVIFSKGGNPRQLLDNMKGPSGQESTEMEFYLAGNVEIRQTNGAEARTLKADEIYYHVSRNKAIAIRARLEMKPPQIQDPIVVRAEEIRQLSATTYEAKDAEIFSSKLPSDPGLKVHVKSAVIEEREVPRLSVFGQQIISRETGAPLTKRQTWVESEGVTFEARDVPFFYLPKVSGDARDPLGPVEDIRIGGNRLFGVQLGVGLNMYDLLGVQPYEGTRWLLDVDYLSRRGPGLGTKFDYSGQDIFGIESSFSGSIDAYGLYDSDDDIFAGIRTKPFDPDGGRGRFLWRQNVWDLPNGFTVQSQIDYWTDRNFLEQYFKREYDTGLPHASYLYVKQQQGSWSWNVQARGRLMHWFTDTDWLPHAEAHLLGYSFADLVTYNSTAGAGFARLRTSNDLLPAISPTDITTNTGRLHWFQEASVPFSLAALRVVPYAKMDLAGYTNDLTGDASARIWGGGGVRASLPLSQVFPNVKSELLNVNGINHKVRFHANYFYAGSNEPYTRYPQLDRLNDDTGDMALRDIRPFYPAFLSAPRAASLATPLFDPQVYAIRRLIDTRFDTLDEIQTLQFGVSQRWQTKRGYPGNQHIIDWMTLDMSASYFPQKRRDNFGKDFAFLEYDWSWNIGDRTTLVSNGWVDPIENGPRVFSVGAFLNRSDRTNFYLGYRHLDPVQSKAIIGSVTYIFSPKYAMTAGTSYDFGTSTALTNSLVFTRIGTDVTFSFGLTYDALQKNVGALVEIIPNLVPEHRRRQMSLNTLGRQ